MTVQLSQEVQIILTSIQLALYIFLAIVSLFKIISAIKNQSKFLMIFYLFVLLDICVYCTMIIYQIAKIALNQDLYLVVLVIINIYTMIVEVVLLSLLSFNWKQSEAVLRGSALESQETVENIKIEFKARSGGVLLWLLTYTAFLIYCIVTNTYIDDLVYEDIFIFGGQGLSVLLLVWSNLSQAISARKFSYTLKKYQVLVSYPLNKQKFRCLYWLATFTNFLRLLYLITAIILLRVLSPTAIVEWLAMLIYTASGLFPLAVYLYSFQISKKKSNLSLQSFSESSQNSHRQSKDFYQPPKISQYQRSKDKYRQSFNETQLSNSYDSKGENTRAI